VSVAVSEFPLVAVKVKLGALPEFAVNSDPAPFRYTKGCNPVGFDPSVPKNTGRPELVRNLRRSAVSVRSIKIPVHHQNSETAMSASPNIVRDTCVGSDVPVGDPKEDEVKDRGASS
jgi:hypothetical protein